jgi:polysaccharide biosynthesis protein PslH
MKILFVVPYPPSLIRVRPYHMIRELSRHGHQVTVATLWVDEKEREDIAHLSTFVHKVYAVEMPRQQSYVNCLRALPTRKPLQAVYSWNPELLNKIDGINSHTNRHPSFDIVHVEHLRGSQYGLWIKKKFPDLPVVWDSVDCISLLFKLASGLSKKIASRVLTSFELGRTRLYEAWLPGEFDHTLVTSRLDREAMLELSGDGADRAGKISVLPNGVDLDYFNPDESLPREDDTLVVSGKMSYHANVTMVLNLVEKIMPHLWVARPKVKLWVVGKDPTQEIWSLSQNPNITVTGTVDDIRPYLRKASVAVSPVIYGVGIQNKVLEAMACGTAVVSTPQAVSTLDVIPGKDILVEQDAEQFAAGVLKLLDNPQHRDEIGRAGYQYVLNNHKWTVVAERLKGIYHEAVNNKL